MDGVEAIDNLIEVFRVLEQPIAAERQTWREGQEGMMHRLWDVIAPIVVFPLMTQDRQDDAALTSFFGWMEATLLEGDKEVVNWVDTGILERLGDDLGWIARARPFMGPLTIEYHRMVQSWWGRDDGFYNLGPPGPPPETGHVSPPVRPWSPPDHRQS
jgi:hypothetical protein